VPVRHFHAGVVTGSACARRRPGRPRRIPGPRGRLQRLHTAGYAERQGEVPREQWLTGSAPLGYTGPWGTTYATNLRLRMQDMSEAQWLEYSAHLRARPIMPDFALRAMSEDDRRALYHFIRGLGPAGERAPDALPPGQTPPPPYLALVLPPAPAAGIATAAEPH